MRPCLLDSFCGAGGCTKGYKNVGFGWIVGIDNRPQPNYCGDDFILGDALEILGRLLAGEGVTAQSGRVYFLSDFDAIHASPPCQFYASLSRGDHWRSIPPTRELLEQTGLPYVIENIADAAWDMRSPVRLCGSMFGLHVRRHRLFETTLPMFLQQPCNHAGQGDIRAYYGKPGWAAWTPAAAVVNGGDRKPLLRGSVEQAVEDMGIDWMTWDELREAIPPAYTELIGHQLLARVANRDGLTGGGNMKHKPCPACGNTEWYIDYDQTADGEMRVDRCEVCDWPPNAPYSVEEWRAKWKARKD